MNFIEEKQNEYCWEPYYWYMFLEIAVELYALKFVRGIKSEVLYIWECFLNLQREWFLIGGKYKAEEWKI